jgi:hypothetical protein
MGTKAKINTTRLMAKRCPFCNEGGGGLTFDLNGFLYWVRCRGCGATGPEASTRREAASLWCGHSKDTNPDALVINRRSNHHEMAEIED